MLQLHRGIPFAARANPGGQALSGDSMLELEFAGLSDPGRVRGHNEDYLGYAAPNTADEARTRGWLFALADGVGGQEGGEVASSTAVESLLASFRSLRSDGAAGPLLEQVIQRANLKVYETGAATRPGGSSMCTTLVACVLRYDRVTIAHVGDSRCYLIRRAQATVLTNDHSLVGEQVRMGLLSEQEAASSEQRHVLSRSLGANMFVNTEINEQQILPGDFLMLSSDGLHGALTLGEIGEIVSEFHNRIQQAAEQLVARAKEKDGSDNISVQLILIKNVERVGMYRGRPYKLR